MALAAHSLVDHVESRRRLAVVRRLSILSNDLAKDGFPENKRAPNP